MKNWRNVWWVSLVILVLVSLTLSNVAIADGKKLKDGYITRDRMMGIAKHTRVIHGIPQKIIYIMISAMRNE
jgi:hypothetical protein